MWQPWIGSDYERRRMLILGESCYSWEEGSEIAHPQPDHPSMIVKWAIEDYKALRFSTMLTRGLCNANAPTPEQVTQAWHSVAFTNYVPETVGIGSRVAPSRAQWTQAKAEWPELLELLRPRRVIVVGHRNWNNMPHTPINTPSYWVGGYRLNDGSSVMCHAIYHPASGGSWDEMQKAIAAAEATPAA